MIFAFPKNGLAFYDFLFLIYSFFVDCFWLAFRVAHILLLIVLWFVVTLLCVLFFEVFFGRQNFMRAFLDIFVVSSQLTWVSELVLCVTKSELHLTSCVTV
jgi:hypothetical protein